MLTLKQKKDIFGLISQGFEKEVDIPLATLAIYLKDKNIDYSEFGYKKMKSLLNDLEFLSLKIVKEKGHDNVYAVIHDFSDGKKKHEDKTEIKLDKNKKQVKENKNIQNSASEVKKGKNSKLNQKEKDRILSLLLKGYDYERIYPLSHVSQFLLDEGITNKDYGYSKMRNFLREVSPLIELKENKEKNLIDVIIHKENKAKNDTTNKKNSKPDKSNNKDNNYPNMDSDDVLLPDQLCLSIKEFTNLGLDNNSLKERILQDYRKAKQDKKIIIKDDCHIYPLSFLSKDKENLIASIKKNEAKNSTSYFINFVGADREKPKNALKNDIYFSDYDKSIKELSLLAKKEKWCYHHSSDPLVILKIYFPYTYYRLVNENKVIYDSKSGFAAFNTGLKTDEYEDIYAVLLKSKDSSIEKKYIFQGFTVCGTQGLGKIIIEHFNPLPMMAEYIEDKSNLIFDTDAEIHTDDRHIILDNIKRFPLSYLSTMTAPFPEEKKLLETIKKTKNEIAKDNLFIKLEKAIEKNNFLYSLLKVSLDNTIAKAKRMVKYDYRMALPSFFPTRNVISMMLPLEFTTGNGIEAVLLVEKTQSGNYQGQTILTLKQSYVNARLISSLENTYLDPGKIED